MSAFQFPDRRSAPPALSFAVTRDQETVLIVLRGELNHCNSPLLNDLVDDLMATGPVRMLVLDLAGITFACSASVRALLLADQVIEDHSGHLILRTPSPILRRVLTATGDIRYFQTDETAEGAA